MTQRAGRACKSIWDRRGLRWLAAFGVAAIVAVAIGVAHVPQALACVPYAPTNTAAPVMSPTGTGNIGTVLSTTAGSWSESCGSMPAPTYQWKLCDSSGANCTTNISGATGSSHTTTSADWGSGSTAAKIRAVVTRCDATYDDCTTVTSTGMFAVNPAPPTAGVVVIGGTPKYALTLSATASGFGLGAPSGQYQYKWYTCVNASDPTSNCTLDRTSNPTSSTMDFYTAAAGDVDKYIKVVATVTNSSGSPSATSPATSVVQGVAPTAGSVALTGTAQSGHTLTATASGFTLGTPAGQYTYYWYACASASNTPPSNCTLDRTSSPTSSNTDAYTTVATDVDKYVKVVATATNSCTSGCGSASATSSATGVIQGVAPTAGSVAVSGTAKFGQTLTATVSGFTLGAPAAQYEYQWWRCGSVIDGDTYPGPCTAIVRASDSTSSSTDSYTAVADDVDHYLKVVVTALNNCSSGCDSVSATSPQMDIVEGVAPTAGSVVITGTPSFGQTLTATPSGFTLGEPSGQYVYDWYRCTNASDDPSDPAPNNCTPEPSDSNTDTYTIVADDAGSYLKVVATVTNGCLVGCGSASATSSATDVVQGSAAPTAGSVVVSGIAQVNQTLTATASGFTLGRPTGHYTYSWYACADASDDPANCTLDKQSSSTSSNTNTYTVGSGDADDIEQYIKVVATVTNTCAGCVPASATSSATDLVPAGSAAILSLNPDDSDALTAVPSGFDRDVTSVSYSYQWKYFDSSDDNFHDIPVNGTDQHYEFPNGIPEGLDNLGYLAVEITATQVCSSGCDGPVSATSPCWSPYGGTTVVGTTTSLSDGGEVRTYALPGCTGMSVPTPPANFDPQNASADDLATFDFPPRPSGADAGGDALAVWTDVMSHYHNGGSPYSTPVAPSAESDGLTSTIYGTWAGYAAGTEGTTGNRYTGVQAEFTVPSTPACDSETGTAPAIWIGLGGTTTYPSADLAQQGITCGDGPVGSGSAFRPFIEFTPNEPGVFCAQSDWSFSSSGGDVLYEYMKYDPSSASTVFFIEDLTTGTAHSCSVATGSPSRWSYNGDTADYVVEADTGSDALPSFDATDFSFALAELGSDSSWVTLGSQPYNKHIGGRDSQNVCFEPTELASEPTGDSFSVNWLSSSCGFPY